LNVLEALKKIQTIIYYNQTKAKINKPSLEEGCFGSDRESFDNCDCLGGGRISIVDFLGLIISHLTRTLYKQFKIRK
jgi:hypothetical protein